MVQKKYRVSTGNFLTGVLGKIRHRGKDLCAFFVGKINYSSMTIKKGSKRLKSTLWGCFLSSFMPFAFKAYLRHPNKIENSYH